MRKYSIYLVLITLIISSCNTLHNFNHQKYFDFKNSSADIKKTDATVSAISAKEPFESAKSKMEIAPLQKTEEVLINPPSNEIAATELVKLDRNKGGVKSVDNANFSKIQAYISKANTKSIAPSSGVKGKLWWIFMIVAFIGLIIALLASALIGTLIFIGALAVGIIMLLMYLHTKGNAAEPAKPEKKSRDNPTKPKKEPETKKQKRG
jgi:hypothetical protein